MHVEKLYYLCWPAHRSFLHLVVTPGNTKLADLAGRFVDDVHRRVDDVQIRLILDAGAAISNEGLVRLDRCKEDVFLIRAPRRKGYRERWQALPRESFTPFEEPGRYVGAKDKECEIAETTTAIKGIDHPVRTIVVRERAMHGKDRWHSLFILHDDKTPPLDLLHEYRTRQHHEQGHRIGVHDLWIDTSPSGYPKSSRPDRPGFRQGPLALPAWIAALVWGALCEISALMPEKFHLAFPRTLRRWLLERNAELIVTPSHLLVVLTYDRRRAWLRPLLQRFNEAQVALPWFAGRRVVMGFAAPSQQSQQLPDARPVLPELAEVGSDPAAMCGGVWC
jgi:hypothetical protein